MSHKKRASTAFKSMGAAGLAAATIVSGLSFGPAAATAAEPSTVLADGVFVQRMATGWIAYDGTTRSQLAPVLDTEARRTMLSGTVFDTRDAAVAAAKAAGWDRWSFPAVGTQGQIKFNDDCLALINGYWLSTTTLGWAPYGAMSVGGCLPSTNPGQRPGVISDWVPQADGSIKSPWDAQFSGPSTAPKPASGIWLAPSTTRNGQATSGWWQPGPGDTVIPEDPGKHDLTASAAFGSANKDKVTVSGEADANSTVTVSDANGRIASTTANDDGAWSTTIDAPAAGGDYAITVAQTGSSYTPVNLTIRYGAAVSITSPTAGQTVPAGDATVTVATQAGADLSVDAGGEPVTRTATSATETITVPGVTAGTRTISVTQHSKGDLTTKDSVSVTVEPPAPGRVDLTASVTMVNNIAKTAVVTGTATPGAMVSIGEQEVEADTETGAWTITVTGLEVGENELTVVQTIGGTKHDEKTVTATIVDGGTLVGVDQGPVTLERGERTQVPFVVENREFRTGTKATVTLTAPENTSFDGQSTVQGSWRAVGATNWSGSSSIPLTNGTVADEGKTLTFDVDWNNDRPVNQQYRYLINVTADQDAPAGSGAMEFTMPGTSSKGDFKAEGKTTTTIETAEVALDAKVESVDHAAKTAVVSGTATPAATVSIGEQSIEADEETGAWSITVRDLDEGTNELTVTQKIGDKTIDTKDLTVTINSAAISGQDGTPVTLERDGDTSVEALFKTNGSISRPQGTVEFTAPEGTTFAAGQNTINGSFQKPGEEWTNSAMTLSNGVRSEDGTKYTYDFRTTTSTWHLPADSLMRWNIKVSTPADAEASTPSMSTKLVGTATEGAFNTTSTTSTTIESAEAPAPAPLVVTSPENGSTVDTKRPVFSGTGDEGATIEVRGKSGRLVATAVVKDGEWSAPASFDLNDNSYTLDVFQKPLQGAPSQTEITFRVATNPLTTELTAVGAFDDDLTKPATISGDATTGAIVIVKDDLGNEIGRTEAKDGKYSIPVPPSAAHVGVNDFTVTQTKNGSTSPEKDVQLDYGTPAALNITSPEDNSTVQKQGLTFTGTGDEGARIDIRGTVRAIATGTVENGSWTAPVTVDLSNNIYNLRAVQTTKGGLTTQQPITITIVDEAPAAPLTATARFNTTDENLPAEMTGTANPGATITVKDSNGGVVNTGQASNSGTYTVLIPANKVHTGVNDFTVTQTVRGQVSPELERSLDYGTPAAPVIQTPDNGATVTNGSIRFTGTGATGAKLDMRGNTSSIGATTITDGTWSVDVTRQLNPNVYALHALQTSKGGLTQRADITVTIRNRQITDLTATGTFLADVEQNATISGNAETGADVVIKEGTTVIKSVKAENGKYSVEIPATTDGVRTFTVTQTVNGDLSDPKTVTLDYGTITALNVETPTAGSTLPGNQVVFTGTGNPGAKITLGGTVSRLGTATVNTQGNWSITVERTLTPRDYALYTTQITKGNLTGKSDMRIITITN